jgi:hypothetical protein
MCCLLVEAQQPVAGTLQPGDGVRQMGGGSADTPSVRNIKLALDSLLFVRRFQSVETPCIVINPDQPDEATVYPDMVNSRYRVSKKTDRGVLCLSENCAQYLRLSHGLYIDSNQSVQGNVELTYAYPSSSIIQYLGMTYAKSQTDRSQWLFNYFLRSLGAYTLSKQNGRYEIVMVLSTEPYSPLDTIYGYLELVRSVLPNDSAEVYEFFFDQMKMHKGDDVQIFQKYTTATFDSESMFYSNMLANALIGLRGQDSVALRNAIWVRNFYGSPNCPMCGFIFGQALYSAMHLTSSRPNTNPYPAH